MQAKLPQDTSCMRHLLNLDNIVFMQALRLERREGKTNQRYFWKNGDMKGLTIVLISVKGICMYLSDLSFPLFVNKIRQRHVSSDSLVQNISSQAKTQFLLNIILTFHVGKEGERRKIILDIGADS